MISDYIIGLQEYDIMYLLLCSVAAVRASGRPRKVLCFEHNTYIYIYIERERDRYTCMYRCVCVCVCVFVHTHTHIYIYIYIGVWPRVAHGKSFALAAKASRRRRAAAALPTSVWVRFFFVFSSVPRGS